MSQLSKADQQVVADEKAAEVAYQQDVKAPHFTLAFKWRAFRAGAEQDAGELVMAGIDAEALAKRLGVIDELRSQAAAAAGSGGDWQLDGNWTTVSEPPGSVPAGGHGAYRHAGVPEDVATAFMKSIKAA